MENYFARSAFSFFLVFLAFLAVVQVSFSQKKSSFIGWDDITVDVPRGGWSITNDYNRTRVIIVDKNGGGHSLTVQGAVDMIPENNADRMKIYILPGIYREKVLVPKNKPFISFIGNESQVSNTVITWNNKASDKGRKGHELGTSNSSSVTIMSDYFCATGITFENTIVAVPGEKGMQAVALRLSGDKAMLYKIRVLGTQDTLRDESGSHYFYQCYIQGSMDFIFGGARSLYKNCVLHSTAKNSGAIAAHGRDSPNENTGFSFVNCVINGTGQIYLGRAWGRYSRVIYSNSFIDDIINPAGWSDWDIPGRQKTVVFGEYQCSGKGADTSHWVPWSRTLSLKDVRPFLDITFIDGNQWLRL